jgi:hypothetical protein
MMMGSEENIKIVEGIIERMKEKMKVEHVRVK